MIELTHKNSIEIYTKYIILELGDREADWLTTRDIKWILDSDFTKKIKCFQVMVQDNTIFQENIFLKV